MRIVRDAIEAVQENLAALLIYLAITVSSQLLARGVPLLLQQASTGEPAESTPLLAQLALDLMLCVAFACAQCVVFARLGKAIDRPLWKISGAREAVRRFFMLWFMLSVFTLATLHITAALSEAGNTELAMLMYFGMVMLLIVIAVPFGACIMFYGKLEWANLGEILAPLGRQLPMTMMVLLLNLFQFLLIETVMGINAGSATDNPLTMLCLSGALAVIAGYIDCVVFAGTWLICMADRDTERDEGDFDF